MKRFVHILALGLILMAQSAAAQTLQAVKNRGVLNCGSNGTLAGFGLPDANGKWAGLDVDLCRAVAAAILIETLAQLRQVPEMRGDLAKLETSCCKPDSPQLPRQAPQPLILPAAAQ